ncbi:MAG: hypothetical protein ACRDWN_08180, partial [Acidimicrobiales bacterium]
MDDVIVLSPTPAEARSVGAGTAVTGLGAAAVGGAVARLLDGMPAGSPVAVAGTARPLSPALRPGQVVVASELWAPGMPGAGGPGTSTPAGPAPEVAPGFWSWRRLPSAPLLAAELRRCGLDVAVGPLL